MFAPVAEANHTAYCHGRGGMLHRKLHEPAPANARKTTLACYSASISGPQYPENSHPIEFSRRGFQRRQAHSLRLDCRDKCCTAAGDNRLAANSETRPPVREHSRLGRELVSPSDLARQSAGIRRPATHRLFINYHHASRGFLPPYIQLIAKYFCRHKDFYRRRACAIETALRAVRHVKHLLRIYNPLSRIITYFHRQRFISFLIQSAKPARITTVAPGFSRTARPFHHRTFAWQGA
jgi:hypothetical protein